jgi:hypothetical protein
MQTLINTLQTRQDKFARTVTEWPTVPPVCITLTSRCLLHFPRPYAVWRLLQIRTSGQCVGTPAAVNLLFTCNNNDGRCGASCCAPPPPRYFVSIFEFSEFAEQRKCANNLGLPGRGVGWVFTEVFATCPAVSVYRSFCDMSCGECLPTFLRHVLPWVFTEVFGTCPAVSVYRSFATCPAVSVYRSFCDMSCGECSPTFSEHVLWWVFTDVLATCLAVSVYRRFCDLSFGECLPTSCLLLQGPALQEEQVWRYICILYWTQRMVGGGEGGLGCKHYVPPKRRKPLAPPNDTV